MSLFESPVIVIHVLKTLTVIQILPQYHSNVNVFDLFHFRDKETRTDIIRIDK